MHSTASSYIALLQKVLGGLQQDVIHELCQLCLSAALDNKKIFICGNGGSAANATHIANDLIYGANPARGLNAEALTANVAVITCLANDLDYTQIFSHQLEVKASAGDVLIALSGSGNSCNIVEAIVKAKKLGLSSCAIVGFDGGKAKAIADIVLHCDIDDMQIAEDIQLVVGHILMRSLNDALTQ